MSTDPTDSTPPPDPAAPRVTVVVIGDDGWSGLGEAAQELIRNAPLVIGGHRQQTMLPDIPGQDRRRWPTPMLPTLRSLLDAYPDREFLLVTSEGRRDSAVGAALIEELGAANVRMVPAGS